jgi:hypothetical protein
MSAERRKHVRVKPTFDFPASATLAVDSLVREKLTVVDIALGGMALADHRGAPAATMQLRLSLAREPDHDVTVETRWVSDKVFGVAFVSPHKEAETAIKRYVTELLERGSAG